jgi:hypothetical protein
VARHRLTDASSLTALCGGPADPPLVDTNIPPCLFLGASSFVSHLVHQCPCSSMPCKVTGTLILPSNDSQSCWEEGSVGRARALYSNTTELEMIWLLKATCRVTRPVSWAESTRERSQGVSGGQPTAPSLLTLYWLVSSFSNPRLCPLTPQSPRATNTSRNFLGLRTQQVPETSLSILTAHSSTLWGEQDLGSAWTV